MKLRQQHLSLVFGVLMAWAGIAPLASAQQAPPASSAPNASMHTEPWQSRCTAAGVCVAERSFVLKKGDQGQRLLTVRLQRQPEGQGTVLALLGPLGVRIPPGVRVDAIAGQVVTLPYALCASIGCSAETKLTPQAYDELIKEKPITVSFQQADGNQIVVKADLAGLGQAVGAWR
jgi:invasion protein IalB